MQKTGTGRAKGPRKVVKGKAGRPRRRSTRQRKQLVVDVVLLEQAMVITGRNQSDTVNEALAQLTENAAILGGFEQMQGAFPEHPDHTAAP